MVGSNEIDAERSALDLLIRGFQVSQMIRIVADLNLADRVPANGHADLADLAAACGVHAQPLLRIIRALAAVEIFVVTPGGEVRHTARSQLLRTDTANSMHFGARFWAGPGSWKAWGNLEVALTGEVPHRAAWDTDRFAYLRAHPEEARIFDEMMAHFPDNRHAAVAETYDFHGLNLIADIGGGNGAALRHILAGYPNARGLLFDRDDVVRAVTDGDLMEGRIKVVGGSFFEAVPTGADAYILSRVLHDWSDQDCRRILRVCRAAMRGDSRLLIVEHVIEPEPRRGRATDYLTDMQMMAMFGTARGRTEVEFRGLLPESGFELRNVVTTKSPVSILEAVPIQTTCVALRYSGCRGRRQHEWQPV